MKVKLFQNPQNPGQVKYLLMSDNTLCPLLKCHLPSVWYNGSTLKSAGDKGDTMDTTILQKMDGYVIRLSEHALITLILNGLEAYCVQHENKTPQLETCGALFGYQIPLRGNRILYQIEMANVDTSAKRNKRSVTPNTNAMRLKAEIMETYWPNLQYLGDYHTHVYKSLDDVYSVELEEGDRRGDDKGYYISNGDRRWLEANAALCLNYGYRVGLVVTIAGMKRNGNIGAKPANTRSQAVEFNLGKRKVWISAYYAYEEGGNIKYSSNNDRFITLECPSLLGFRGEI